MNENSSPYQIVLTTFPDKESARRLAETLITQKYAACVNILPIMTSIYRWNGKLEEGQEHQLVIKTEKNCVEDVRRTILDIHPYELPEFITVPITNGHQPYLNWISASVQQYD